MNIIKTSIKPFSMRIKGYKPVKLKDTRHVLNESNNTIFVKTELDKGLCPITKTILPSGTIIKKRFFPLGENHDNFFYRDINAYKRVIKGNYQNESIYSIINNKFKVVALKISKKYNKPDELGCYREVVDEYRRNKDGSLIKSSKYLYDKFFEIFNNLYRIVR